MIAVDDKLMDSWYALIGNSLSVNVYKEGSVPEDDTENYVELRMESEFADDTKQSFRSDVVLITDIVTFHNVAIDRSIVSAIDNEIKGLVKPQPQMIGLGQQSGMQIQNVYSSTAGFMEEFSNGKKIYRKIVRYTHRINQ
jgi:hypothetical protein